MKPIICDVNGFNIQAYARRIKEIPQACQLQLAMEPWHEFVVWFSFLELHVKKRWRKKVPIRLHAGFFPHGKP